MPPRAAPAPPLRFLFFGAGAVGSLLGARLAQAGSEVTLIGRPPHVEAVARAHGGRVLVDSRPGVGSEFTLELPRPEPKRDSRQG